MTTSPLASLIDELVEIGGETSARLVDSARVQAPGLALEELVLNLTWHNIPITVDLRDRLLAVATWPELKDALAQALTA